MKNHRRTRIIAVVLLLCGGTTAAFAQQMVIKGTLGKPVDGQVSIVYETPEGEVTDSARVVNGNFVLRHRLPRASLCTLRLSGSPQLSLFFGENRDMRFETKNAMLVNGKMQGGKEQTVWSGFQPWLNARLPERRMPRDTVFAKALDSLTTVYVQQHKSSAAAALILYKRFVEYPDRSKARELYGILGREAKNSFYGKKTAFFLDAEKRAFVGNTVPAFVLPDSSGVKHSLAALKGKYYLLDFWASWCVPCRKEHPALIRLYEQYRKHGFEIVSISVDQGKEMWRMAIRTDGLPWLNLSDLKGGNGEAPAFFGVKSVPYNVLVDPEGRMIGFKLKTEELVDKLKSIYPE